MTNNQKKLIGSILIGLIINSIVMATEGFGFRGGKKPDDNSVIYYFGYEPNLEEIYFKHWKPSAKRLTIATLPNYEIQF